MTGLNVKQFKTLVRDTLKDFGGTVDVVNLVTGTCMVESGLTYLAQVNGPALGIGQMEPTTFNDLKVNFLRGKPNLMTKVTQTTGSTLVPGDLVWNLKLAIIMTRLKYLTDPYPVPSTAADLAQYHKRVYNTYLGKADADKNTPIFQSAINA